MSHKFGPLIDILPSSSKHGVTPMNPPAVHAKPIRLNISPDPVELEIKTTLPNEPGNTSYSPRTPNELEMSRPPSPKFEEAVSTVQSFSSPPMNRFRVLSACAIYFANGMNDSAPGALIPYMETHYNIGYGVVSLVFVTNAIGFIAAAFFVDMLDSKIGRARSLMLAESIVLVGYIMLVCTPPYADVVLSYFFMGFGAAIGLALDNVFCANLANPTVILGASHGSYGIGGTVAPIAATALASNGILWSRFYSILLGLRVLNIIFAGWSFWNFEHGASSQPSVSGNKSAGASGTDVNGMEQTKMQTFLKAVKNRITILGALFIFAYQGAEVALSGWIISFLISYRDGDPAKVGYVTAGFWGGITIGRFVLTHVAHRVGEKPFVFAMIFGCLAFQLLTWFIPNVVSNAVSVAILGLLLGPVYPCAQTIFSRSLPRNLQMTSIGFISSAGSSGGAIAPFTTGLLAQAVGTWVLHPVCVAMFAAMAGCWWAIPKVGKRRE